MPDLLLDAPRVMDDSRYNLSPAQLGELARKALTNARSLLEEAKELARLDSPRSLALAVLAAEEFGKHMMCFGALGLQPDDEPGWLKFRKRFRRHEPKHLNMLGMVLMDESDGYSASCSTSYEPTRNSNLRPST